MPAPTYLGGNQTGASTYSGHSTSVACNFSYAITVPTGTTFLIVNFCASLQNAGTTGTPTFNGQAMATYLAPSTTGWNRRYIFYKVNPTVGTSNFALSFGTATNWGITAAAACFKDVDPANPFVNYTTTTPTGSTWSTTLTSDPFYYYYAAIQFTDRTADEKTVGVNAPGVLFGYRGAGYDDSTASPQGALSVAAGKAGAAGTNTITFGFPYGCGGTCYNINLRGYTPAAKARSQTIIIM